MTVLCAGLPGPFTEWVEHVAAHLLERGGRRVMMGRAATLAEVGALLLAAPERQVVIGLRQPDAALHRAFLGASRLRLICEEDPVLAALHMIERNGVDVARAVKAVAASLVSMIGLQAADGALVLRAAMDGLNPAEALLALAHHLGTPLSPTDIGAILDLAHAGALVGCLMPLDTTKAEGGRMGLLTSLQPCFDTLSEHEQAMLTETLGSYARAARDGVPAKVVWPRDLFIISDSPEEAATRAVDIMGRARCLLHGPYMPLLPGSWTARVVLGFSADTLGQSFLVEVVAGSVLGRTIVLSRGEEVRAVEIVFEVGEPDHPIEVRVFNERAAFEGYVALGVVSMAPHLWEAEHVPARLPGRAMALSSPGSSR